MASGFLAVLVECPKCGKKYMKAHQSPKCPHPRIVDTSQFKARIRRAK